MSSVNQNQHTSQNYLKWINQLFQVIFARYQARPVILKETLSFTICKRRTMKMVKITPGDSPIIQRYPNDRLTMSQRWSYDSSMVAPGLLTFSNCPFQVFRQRSDETLTVFGDIWTTSIRFSSDSLSTVYRYHNDDQRNLNFFFFYAYDILLIVSLLCSCRWGPS